jgi:hypothetical protein
VNYTGTQNASPPARQHIEKKGQYIQFGDPSTAYEEARVAH